MKGETIEAVMIVKNEEEVLARCLDSINGIDKITILDTGSTDKTAEIAEAHGATIHVGKYKWKDNFASARNEALKYATCDWILIIDADEVLVGQEHQPVKAKKGRPNKEPAPIVSPGIVALRLAVESVPKEEFGLRFRCFSAGGLDEHIIIRAHRRHPNIEWRGAIHNYLSYQNGPVVPGLALVYGHSPAHNGDPERAFRILSREVALHPEKPRETYYLAREYYTRREVENAKSLYERYLKLSNYPPEAADAHLMLARCALALGSAEGAWSHVFSALRINADLSEAYHLLAALSGPINRGHWKRNAAAANDTLALFVRKVDGGDMVMTECSAGASGAVAVSAPLEIEHDASAATEAL